MIFDQLWMSIMYWFMNEDEGLCADVELIDLHTIFVIHEE